MTADVLGMPQESFASTELGPQRFHFTGSGSEYFRIWIVNLLLSIVTLGIYSAWAKVRRMRYFYSSTKLADSTFEYHGNPMAILKGRIFVVVLLGAYQLAAKFAPILSLFFFVVWMAVVPWLIWKSLQFKLYNSSYRGIRFHFMGSAKKAYSAYLMLPVVAIIAGIITAVLLGAGAAVGVNKTSLILAPILMVIAIYGAIPFVHQRIKRFQHTESRFGTSAFSFSATPGSFYFAYLIGFLVLAAGMVVIFLVTGLGAAVTMLANKNHTPGAMGGVIVGGIAFYVWLFFAGSIFFTMIQNLIWNKTKLGENQFNSDMHSGLSHQNKLAK